MVEHDKAQLLYLHSRYSGDFRGMSQLSSFESAWNSLEE
jgi:hypothetical protein